MGKTVLTKKWVTVTGLQEVMRKVNDIAIALDGQEILQTLMSGAKIIETEAKRRVPVVTGNLKGAVYSAYGQQRNRKKPSVIGGVNYSQKSGSLKYAPYAHIVEFGSSKHTAKPFFGPSIIAKRGEVALAIKEGLQRILDKTVKQ